MTAPGGVEVDQRGDGFTVVAAIGDVDLANAPVLRDRMTELIADGHVHLVVDLTRSGFLDSTGLGALVGALKRVRLRDGEIRVVCPQHRLRQLFELTSLDKVFPLFDTVDEACARVVA